MANWRDIIGLIRNSVPDLLLRSRSELMSKVGTTFGGGRKHYEIFGWPVARKLLAGLVDLVNSGRVSWERSELRPAPPSSGPRPSMP